MTLAGSRCTPRTRARARRVRVTRLLRHPLTRYGALAVLAATIMIVALAPLASLLVDGWSRQDVELRARLVFRSIREQVSQGIAAPSAELDRLLDRLAEDERILALGFCNEAGRLEYATAQFPKSVSCDRLERARTDTFDVVRDGSRRTHVSLFPVTIGARSGHLLVLHDLAYSEARACHARLYSTLSLIGIAVGLGLLSTAIVLAMMRGWTRSLRNAIVRAGLADRIDIARSEFPVSRDIHTLLNELRLERKLAEGIHIDWSPNTLHRLLLDELPETEVLVVSNREPYIHNRENGAVTLQIPASGLVAAVEPVMRACGGTWIAHGSGTADRETVDKNDRLAVPPADPTYTLRRVWLTEEEQEGYYYGLANEGLWPLCHVAFVRPTFREADWEQYKAVNARFADAVAEEAVTDDPIVLVQDYHFALLPRLIRERLPRATIITFWHIPWPNSETFSIFPWRDEIIDGLLGSTIIGFHTQLHCNNFIEATDRFMESRIDRERDSVTLGGHETLVRAYPISIEWPPSALADQAPPGECRASVIQRFGLPADARIAVGVERFDYTKGILDRIRAVDDLLLQQPEWRGKLVFIQAAAPTRSKLGAYTALQDEAVTLVAEVNARHGSDGYQPIHLVIRHHDPSEVFELFRAADMCIISSLHDGMNLVAKEFVASREDERGVLILSSFAGASRELPEALIVNPYDTRGMALAIGQALRIPQTEQRDRMRLMRDFVRQRNVYRWAGQMLLDAARLRRRDSILRSVEDE